MNTFLIVLLVIYVLGVLLISGLILGGSHLNIEREGRLKVAGLIFGWPIVMIYINIIRN